MAIDNRFINYVILASNLISIAQFEAFCCFERKIFNENFAVLLLRASSMSWHCFYQNLKFDWTIDCEGK